MYPPISFAIPRVATENTLLDGIPIRKGTYGFVVIITNHYNPNTY